MSPPTRRALLLLASIGFLVAACTATPVSTGGPDAGYCASNGYASPAGGSCPKGTCAASGVAIACCSSECASCEAKGLVSYTGAGACPAGLCASADVTASLRCCDSCSPIGALPGDAGETDGGQGELAGDAGAREGSSD